MKTYYTDRIIARHFKLPVAAIRRNTKRERILYFRYAAILLAHEVLGFSLNKLKRAYHKRSHSTIHHALAEARNLLETKPSFRAKYQAAHAEATDLMQSLQEDKQRYNLHFRLRSKNIPVDARSRHLSIKTDQEHIVANAQVKRLLATHNYNVQYALL